MNIFHENPSLCRILGPQDYYKRMGCLNGTWELSYNGSCDLFLWPLAEKGTGRRWSPVQLTWKYTPAAVWQVTAFPVPHPSGEATRSPKLCERNADLDWLPKRITVTVSCLHTPTVMSYTYLRGRSTHLYSLPLATPRTHSVRCSLLFLA